MRAVFVSIRGLCSADAGKLGFADNWDVTRDSTPPFEAIAQAIDAHSSFLIAAHVGPDGDAIGSALALRSALIAVGKKAWVVSSDGVPVSCRFLPGANEVLYTPPSLPECAFILDCDGTRDRVASPYGPIQKAQQRVLIDHHRTSKPIFEVNWLDPSQSATALMIWELLKYLRVEITPDIAQCLLCGLSTDTGNFRFPNTSSRALIAASELVDAGADLALIAFKLFDERSLESTRLLATTIDKMEVESSGKLTWSALTLDDFARTRVGDEGTDNVVNFLRNVRGARMSLLFRERIDETGPVAHISARAEPNLRADLFCALFGGGGHAAAAGCRIRHAPFEASVRRVVEAAKAWVEQEHPSPDDSGG
jgi:phosphoesterase RecJ-like protein